MTTKVLITSAELRALKWENVEGKSTSYFESGEGLLQISVLPKGGSEDQNPCNRCDSHYKSTGEVRLRLVWGACMGSLSTNTLPGCGGSKTGPPYQVVLVRPPESTLLPPTQPSLF